MPALYASLRQLFPRRAAAGILRCSSHATATAPPETTCARKLHTTAASLFATQDAFQSTDPGLNDTTSTVSPPASRSTTSSSNTTTSTRFQGRDTSRSPARTSRTGPRTGDDRCVFLQYLPETLVSDDISGLAGADELCRSRIQSIRLLYNRLFNPSGRAIVNFYAPSVAERFQKMADGSLLGGRSVQAKIMDHSEAQSILLPLEAAANSPAALYNGLHLRSRLASVLLSISSGKLVYIRGLPLSASSERLRFLLRGGGYTLQPATGLSTWSRYLAEREKMRLGEHGWVMEHGAGKALEQGKRTGIVHSVVEIPPLQQEPTTRSFLIRFKTESEAHRFVRRWHRVPFDPERYNYAYMVDARVMY